MLSLFFLFLFSYISGREGHEWHDVLIDDLSERENGLVEKDLALIHAAITGMLFLLENSSLDNRAK